MSDLPVRLRFHSGIGRRRNGAALPQRITPKIIKIVKILKIVNLISLLVSALLFIIGGLHTESLSWSQKISGWKTLCATNCTFAPDAKGAMGAGECRMCLHGVIYTACRCFGFFLTQYISFFIVVFAFNTSSKIRRGVKWCCITVECGSYTNMQIEVFCHFLCSLGLLLGCGAYTAGLINFVDWVDAAEDPVKRDRIKEQFNIQLQSISDVLGFQSCVLCGLIAFIRSWTQDKILHEERRRREAPLIFEPLQLLPPTERSSSAIIPSPPPSYADLEDS